MNNKKSVKLNIKATSPTEPFPGYAMQVIAAEHALRLARSAHIELKVAIAIQAAWMSGVSTSTPKHVHDLLDLPWQKLARRFLKVVSNPASNAAERSPSWEHLAEQVVALEAQYHDLVKRLRPTTEPVDIYKACEWTASVGYLANDLMTCHSDSPEFWELFQNVAVDVKDSLWIHLA